MPADDPLDGGEADPGPGKVRLLVEALERDEEALLVGGIKTHSIVGQDKLIPTVSTAGVEMDRGEVGLRRELPGILQKVGQSDLQQGRIPTGGHSFLHDHIPDAIRFGRLEAFDNPLGHRGQVHLGHLEFNGPDPSQSQEAFDQASHPFRLRPDPAEVHASDLIQGVGTVLLQRHDPAGDSPEGSPQVMGDRVGERLELASSLLQFPSPESHRLLQPLIGPFHEELGRVSFQCQVGEPKGRGAGEQEEGAAGVEGGHGILAGERAMPEIGGETADQGQYRSTGGHGERAEGQGCPFDDQHGQKGQAEPESGPGRVGLAQKRNGRGKEDSGREGQDKSPRLVSRGKGLGSSEEEKRKQCDHGACVSCPPAPPVEEQVVGPHPSDCHLDADPDDGAEVGDQRQGQHQFRGFRRGDGTGRKPEPPPEDPASREGLDRVSEYRAQGEKKVGTSAGTQEQGAESDPDCGARAQHGHRPKPDRGGQPEGGPPSDPFLGGPEAQMPRSGIGEGYPEHDEPVLHAPGKHRSKRPVSQ